MKQSQKSGPGQSPRQDDAQQGPLPFQPPVAAGEPSWQKILIIFGVGLAITVIPLFAGFPLYGSQFLVAIVLFWYAKKTQDATKRMAGHAMTGMMCLLGLVILALGLLG